MTRDLKSTHPPDLMVKPPSRPVKQSVYGAELERLHDSISKIAYAVNKSAKHTEQIPAIKKKIDMTREKIVQLDTKMDVTTERVTRMEDKIERGHDCYQVDIITELKRDHRNTSQKIDTDMLKGVEQETRIDNLSRDVASTERELDDVRKTPRRLFYGLLSIVFALITGAISTAMFLTELSKDVEFERVQRTEQNSRMESLIKTIGTKSDNAPVKKALRNLERELESFDAHEDLCKGMPARDKRTIKTTLSRRGKRVPVSCL